MGFLDEERERESGCWPESRERERKYLVGVHLRVAARRRRGERQGVMVVAGVVWRMLMSQRQRSHVLYSSTQFLSLSIFSLYKYILILARQNIAETFKLLDF